MSAQMGHEEYTVESSRQLQFLDREIPGTFVFYAFIDPGHSWVRVRKDVLRKLGITHKISPCSYMNKQFAYLEEDVDAPLLIKALKARGISVRYRDRVSYRPSTIRKFERYRSN
jgi:hypothetical protein